MEVRRDVASVATVCAIFLAQKAGLRAVRGRLLGFEIREGTHGSVMSTTVGPRISVRPNPSVIREVRAAFLRLITTVRLNKTVLRGPESFFYPPDKGAPNRRGARVRVARLVSAFSGPLGVISRQVLQAIPGLKSVLIRVDPQGRGRRRAGPCRRLASAASRGWAIRTRVGVSRTRLIARGQPASVFDTPQGGRRRVSKVRVTARVNGTAISTTTAVIASVLSIIRTRKGQPAPLRDE